MAVLYDSSWRIQAGAQQARTPSNFFIDYVF